MTDNQVISSTAVFNAASEDIGGNQYQKTKLVDGSPGSTTPIPGDATRGLKVNAGPIARLSLTPTISAGAAYLSGDAVGGLLTFTNAARFSGGGLTIRRALLIDRDQEGAVFDLVLFDRTFTSNLDNDPFDPTDADLANFVGSIPISTYVNFTDNAVGFSPMETNLPILLSGTSLFGQLVTRGTPTYTATNDVTIILSVVQE